ncbi:MAG: hypothetical protein WD029_08240, partial [Microthrixaceae bacterium]
MTQTTLPWTGLLATAEQLGAFVWVEAKVSSILGAWVATEPDPFRKVELNARSSQHRWQSELLFERLPVLAVVTPEDLVRPPDLQFELFLDLIASTEPGQDQLVAMQQVLLPYLLEVYQQELRSLSEISDASARKTLTVVIANLRSELLLTSTALDPG